MAKTRSEKGGRAGDKGKKPKTGPKTTGQRRRASVLQRFNNRFTKPPF